MASRRTDILDGFPILILSWVFYRKMASLMSYHWNIDFIFRFFGIVIGLSGLLRRDTSNKPNAIFKFE